MIADVVSPLKEGSVFSKAPIVSHNCSRKLRMKGKSASVR